MNPKSDFEADAGLIDRLCKGDPHALTAIYDRHARSIYSLFVRITRDQSLAEDLVQELFLRVWNRAWLFDAKRGVLAAWLLAMARNMAIDEVRSGSAQFARRLQQVEYLEEFSHSSSGEPGWTLYRDVCLRTALTNLKSHEKRVMELAYFEGYSQAEIANLLGRPLGTVKSWTRSALSRLRFGMDKPRSDLAGAQQPYSARS